MAYKRIDELNYLPKAEYICLTADLGEDGKPTMVGDNPGSYCKVLDGEKKLFLYDGTNWYQQ